MNEKIEKLAIEAGVYYHDDMYYDDHASLQRFAELIVRECADYANWYQANSQYTDISKGIKQHFGVEG